MAEYQTDTEDIFFNLFEVLKVQELSEGAEVAQTKDILTQFDHFLKNEIFPSRIPSDHEGVQFKDGQVHVAESLREPLKKYYECGWMGLGLPEEIGGMPVSSAVETAITSLLCGANVSFSMYPGLTKSAVNCLREVGGVEKFKKYLNPMVEGRFGGTMCLTEPDAGSDVGALKTTATPRGDGTYSLKGSKIFISSGESDLYENIVHLVLARTPDAPQGTKGISLFVVPKIRLKDSGELGDFNHVICTKTEEKMGLHAQATCALSFGDSGECLGELVGEEFQGMSNMFVMMNEARLLCGLQGEGQGNLAYELTRQYIQERQQFGQALIEHPDVRRMSLKMRAMGRGLRALCLYTASLFDRERQEPGQHQDEIDLLTPLCKAYASDEGFQMSVDAIQLHGGYGYCTEYGIEQFARDTKIATIYEGTNGIQAMDFIGRKILKDGGKTFLKVGEKISKTLLTDEAREFQEERRLLIANQFKAEDILKLFGQKAKNKALEEVLQHATDFLHFCGNLAVAWRLLESACMAKRELETVETSDSKRRSYLESKIVDFRVFCQHYLVRNSSYSATILEFEQNIMKLEL